MRVCVIAEQLDRPEAHLLLGLAERGVGLRLLLPESDVWFDRIPGSHPLELKRRFSPKAMREIRRHLRNHNTQIVHCLRNNRPIANALFACRGLPVRLIAYRGTMGNLGRFDPGSRFSYLHPRVDRIVCVSQAVEDYLLSIRMPAERLTTIYKGHDPDWYSGETATDLTEFGLPAQAQVIGMVANLRELKGVEDLLLATHLLGESMSVNSHRCALCLVGRVQEVGIQKLIDRYAGPIPLFHLGFRPDATRISGAFDVMVMPSRRREGLPRAVIEAMAQRVPAVVTRVGGMPELIRDEVEGRVVPPDNPQALAEALGGLLDNPGFRDECGERARHRIDTEFHLEQSIERTLALYQSVLGNGPTV